MLDIAEQPIGYAAAKKRKKQQEAEDAKKMAVEQQVKVLLLSKGEYTVFLPILLPLYRNKKSGQETKFFLQFK